MRLPGLGPKTRAPDLARARHHDARGAARGGRGAAAADASRARARRARRTCCARSPRRSGEEPPPHAARARAADAARPSSRSSRASGGEQVSRRAARGATRRPSATSTSSRPRAIRRADRATSRAPWVVEVAARGPTKATVVSHDGSASTSASFRPSATATCSSTSRARRTTTSRCARRRSGAGSRSPSTASWTPRPARRSRTAPRRSCTSSSATSSSRPSCARTRRARGGAQGRAAEARRARRPARRPPHAHDWSADGQNTVEEMAHAAIARGYEYFAITDHSHYLREGRMEAQAEEIDALQESVAPFRLLKGVEVNIRADGDARRARRGARERDWVVASVHSALREEPDRARLRGDGEPARRLHRAPDRPEARQARPRRTSTSGA